MERSPGSVIVKNNSGASYDVEELPGLTLDVGAQADLLDPETPSHYGEWAAANRLVTSLPTAKLYQDIQSGDIEVITNTPPKPIRNPEE